MLYGAGESGGFVLLTGEVGTGKTTVCRAFLEQLPEGVEIALILNPAQSANELLTNVCDEFRIPLPKGKLSNKMLVDRLNEYLLEVHAKGRRPVLIIDEAQNLLPQAMEQIRLLTNLETTKHKLLQIFLIGQPELRRMLERDRLRQLNQRITARFHLNPLTLREAGDYIRHRVAVAGVDRPLFSARAIRRIYKFSGGVPRLINILCDRALLGTCVTRGSQVTPAIVSAAAREVRGDPIDETARSPLQLALIALLSFGVAAALAFAANSRLGLDPGQLVAGFVAQEPAEVLEIPDASADRIEVVEEAPDADEPAAGDKPLMDTASVTGEGAELSPSRIDENRGPQPGVLGSPSPADDAEAPRQEALPASLSVEDLALPKAEAMILLLRRWGLQLSTLGIGDPCERILTFGLTCAQEQGRLSHVRFFDLPALLQVTGVDGEVGYVPLAKLGVTEAVLEAPDGAEPVAVADLESAWTGDYLLIWKLPPSGSDLIAMGSSGEDVRWLREQLAKVPDLGVLKSDSMDFDAALESALRAFQASQGLMPDGIAGPRTFIALEHAVSLPGVPRLGLGEPEAEPAEGEP
nr:ExeA family protein [Thiorhodococcus mannitoliphagus]